MQHYTVLRRGTRPGSVLNSIATKSMTKESRSARSRKQGRKTQRAGSIPQWYPFAMDGLDAEPPLQLSRHRPDASGTLRPWDAADELLLLAATKPASSVLLVNDDFGALTTALMARHIGPGLKLTVVNDSFRARQAIAANVEHNFPSAVRDDSGLSLQIEASLDDCQVSSELELVLIKIPKSTLALRHQLFALRPQLSNRARLAGAAMTKHFHTSTIQAFSDYMGECHTTRARKKARAIVPASAPPASNPRSPAPAPGKVYQDFASAISTLPDCQVPESPSSYPIPEPGQLAAETITTSAFGFSAGKLDNGSRFLLQNMPTLTFERDLLDLGCGNGVLGIALQRQYPHTHCVYTDDSHAAVENARFNHQILCKNSKASFWCQDRLYKQADKSVDFIVCNPPFHEKYLNTPETALSMFEDSHRVLRENGTLLIVANRHLSYPRHLKKRFAQCLTLASNKHFAVYRVCH